ncbi:hypothetical protein [Paraclostridium bifermentans]|uniref:hypothetical protein n=1 Tax=Paraclostridium bifermentans TaxID=1490 RepID=UPI00359C2C17
MRLKIKLVIGITLCLIFLGLMYITVKTTLRYQEEYGCLEYKYTKELNTKNKHDERINL